MSRLRAPSVAGVAGGVGASTVAAALAGRDRGVFTGRLVDVLVCRSTCESVLLAGGAARWLREGVGCRPVLAVTADSPTAVTKPITARLELARPHLEALVMLPYVPRWREFPAPLEDVRAQLARSVTELTRPLRDYATAVAELAAAVLAAGQLAPCAPPHIPPLSTTPESTPSDPLPQPGANP